VNHFSRPEKIQEWLDHLNSLPKNKQRDEAIESAEECLIFANEHQFYNQPDQDK
jgi:hypothetical protein